MSIRINPLSLSFAAVWSGSDAVFGLLPLLAAGVFLWRTPASVAWRSVGLWGLLLLALLLPCMKAHLHYPMRLLTATLATPLLQLGGLDVVREGTLLCAPRLTFGVDEACSGVRKLWASLFLASALACFRGLSGRATVALWLATLLAVVIGNALRITALFHLELHAAPYPPWLHDAVGAAAFGITVLLIVAAVRGLERMNVHPNSTLERSEEKG